LRKTKPRGYRINRRRRGNLFELKSHEEWVDDSLYAWTSQIIAGYGSWVVDACPHRRVRRREGTALKWERGARRSVLLQLYWEICDKLEDK
jgi:hypothetical protein